MSYIKIWPAIWPPSTGVAQPSEIEQECTWRSPCHRCEERTVRQEHRLGRSPLTAEIEQMEVSEHPVGNDGDRQHHAMVIRRGLAVKV